MHPSNTHFPIDLIDDGIEISFNDEQSTKAFDSIDSTDDGIYNFFNDEHPEKAFDPIDIGIEISFNDEHPENVPEMMFLGFDEIFNFAICPTFWKYLSKLFDFSVVFDVKSTRRLIFGHFLKHFYEF